MGETIVVIGAGVSGLTTALLLAQDESNQITIVAKHMPGDYDIEYASPFAGANFLPMSAEKDSRLEKRTWVRLKRICEECPDAGIYFEKCQLHRRAKDVGAASFSNSLIQKDPWFRNLFDDYRELPESSVLPGYDSACEFTSVCINTAIYLPWLVGQLLKKGVVLKRAIIRDIGECKTMSHTGKPTTIIINASGLGAKSMGGVNDENMVPIRGQVALVRNEISPMVGVSGTEDGYGEEMYMMRRAAGGGTILGGTYQPNNWESQPDPSIAARILSRVVKARPEIADHKGVGGLSVIRHAVGLRPSRKGGVRIERERLDSNTWVIHNYGHAGWGYQGSYGCAELVVELLHTIQRDRDSRSKL